MHKRLAASTVLEKVTGRESQIVALYGLLKERVHNISHTSIPTFANHREFVLNNPYRIWYLVRVEGCSIGSAYLTKDNWISIFLMEEYSCVFEDVIQRLLERHKPLSEKKSLRPPYFCMNVALTDKKTVSRIKRLGWKRIQTTFALTK